MKIQLSDHFTYKKLINFVIPSIGMMMFISIYGVVDGLFVSNFAGKTAFAAINLIMPFIMVLGGMGFMIGAGGTALVAKTLGENEKEKANRYFTIMVLFTVILGAFLTLIGIVFLKPISYFLGATDDMIGDCLLYGRIVIAFTVSFMLQNLFQNFLITAEKPKLGLFATLGAGITNMVLDALFVGLFGWGVAGAAFATGISQCVGTVIPLVFFFKGKNSPLKFVKTKLEIKPILRACANGSSELMTNISSSIVSMVYNFQLIRYIGENGISAYGVIMYVQFIFISLFIGYVIGVAPIIGFNYGAKNTAELKNIFKKSVILMGGAGVVLSILAFSLANPLAHLFVGYDAELKALTVKAFRLFAPAFLLAGLNIFASSLFTALNNGLISAIISFLRTLVFQLASVLVLPLIFDYDGIWYSITIAEIFAIIISVAFVLAKRKKYGYF